MLILEEKLTAFRDITLDLIKCLGTENFDGLETLFDKRQGLIDSMSSIVYDKQDFKAMCERLQIPLLQEKLDRAMKQKLNNVRGEIRSISNNKNASRNYNQSYRVDSLYLSKKV